ncbi:BamA/TamA family outer membrane protein [Mucilaginibacter sp. AW1-3]
MRRALLLILLTIPLFLNAQNIIRSRVILIGDAGEMDSQQSFVLDNAASKIIKGKTTVVYLGDNIYPTGMGLPGSPEEEQTKNILRTQFRPMRKAGAPVYFVPGNHDWDRMGPLGLAKIKRQSEFLAEQKDSLLKATPANGCPDPTEINISDDMVIIAFDSEWWLYLYNKDNPIADCDCKTNEEIASRFRELLYKNRNKVILLADHHPFESYGHHGGSYILNDYIFPLTSVKENLYIPLPVIGALYPLLRGTFDVPEDNGHPLYRIMIQMVNEAFAGDPNVIHVSGHEHGLQFIKDGDFTQVVSGSGAKRAVVKKGKNSLFAQSIGGYVTVDQMDDKSVKFTYYANVADSTLSPVFTYTKPYVKIKIPVEKSYDIIKGDSITVAAKPDFDKADKAHRLMFGENYRKEWAAPAIIPVIKMSSYKGGLTPVAYGGAHQKHALVLKDASDKKYVLSSIEKYPLILLPQAISQTFAKSWLSDAMSAQHPYGALIAPVIAQAVKVAHTSPIIGYVAADKRLGYYEKEFAGTLCLLEEREPGDSSINTGNMIKELDKSSSNRLDSIEFFRTRLLDWFLGDWDQQQDQLRWLGVQKGANRYFSAVPHDRTVAFYINQGFIPKIASRQFVARYLKGYNAPPKSIVDFFFNGHNLNTRFLSQISYEKWMQVTHDFAAALTDDVLEQSLRRLPLAIYRISHDKLLKEMKYRRDHLMEASDIYYRFLNKTIDIKATDKSELFILKDTLKNNLIVRVNKLPVTRSKSTVYFKVFDPAFTKEVRLFVAKGQDSIVVNNTSSPIKIRIVGGDGHRTYNIENNTKKLDIYEKVNTAVFTGNSKVVVDKKLSNDSANVAYLPTTHYTTAIPLFSTGYDVDQGYFIEGGIKYLRQGFRKNPSSTQQLTVGHAFGYESTRINFIADINSGPNKADAELQFKGYFPNNINFFGRGNVSDYNKTGDYVNFYRAKFNFFTADASLRWQNIAATQSVRLGPSVQYYHYLNDASPNLINHPELVNSYDSLSYTQNKLHIGFMVTYIDDKRDRKILTSWGAYVNSRVQAYAGIGSSAKTFLQWLTEATLYKSVDTHSNFVITEKAGAGITLGQTTFYQSMFLGGENNLIGYKQNRFAGEQMLYNNLEGRWKFNNLFSYILPGQYGVTAAYDIGRVWDRSEQSNAVWHNGFGAGVYFSPSDMALLQVKTGYSVEGWYPYINFTLTF